MHVKCYKSVKILHITRKSDTVNHFSSQAHFGRTSSGSFSRPSESGVIEEHHVSVHKITSDFSL